MSTDPFPAARIKSDKFCRVLLTNITSTLGLHPRDVIPRMATEQARRFLQGREMAATIQWGTSSGCWVFLPNEISRNQIFYVDVRANPPAAWSFKTKGVGGADDTFVLLGHLLPPLTPTRRAAANANCILTDCWVSNGKRTYSNDFLSRQTQLTEAARFAESLVPARLECLLNPVLDIASVATYIQRITSDKHSIVAKWATPSGVILFQRGGLGPVGRSQRSRHPSFFPLTEDTPSHDTPAAPEWVPCKRSDGTLPDQQEITVADKKHLLVVRSAGISRLLAAAPKEFRVKCHWNHLFSGYEATDVE